MPDKDTRRKRYYRRYFRRRYPWVGKANSAIIKQLANSMNTLVRTRSFCRKYIVSSSYQMELLKEARNYTSK